MSCDFVVYYKGARRGATGGREVGMRYGVFMECEWCNFIWGRWCGGDAAEALRELVLYAEGGTHLCTETNGHKESQ